VIPYLAPDSLLLGVPMWTPEHRRAADRRGLRYPSDLTDAEWALVAPAIPPARHGGRHREVNVREVVNGIFYVLWTGCQWNALPKDLPPKSTVHSYFMAPRRMGLSWPVSMESDVSWFRRGLFGAISGFLAF
jgi:transposase